MGTRHDQGHLGYFSVILLASSALLPSCCVTEREHRALVAASRAYYDAVSPVWSAHVTTVAQVSTRSAWARAALARDYGRALDAAEARVR